MTIMQQNRLMRNFVNNFYLERYVCFVSKSFWQCNLIETQQEICVCVCVRAHTASTDLRSYKEILPIMPVKSVFAENS